MHPENDRLSASQKMWIALKWFPVLVGVVATAFAYEHVAAFLQEVRGVSEPPPTESFDTAELEAAGWSFPAVELDETLLEEVLVVPKRGFDGPQGASFLGDGEGGGSLLIRTLRAWQIYDEDGQRAGSRPVKRFGGEVVRFEDADGTAYVLEQRGPHGFSCADEVVCLRDGEELWSRESSNLGWIGTDAIYTEDDRALVLLFGYDDWIALRPGGEVAWDRSDEFHAGYNHSTHPELPGIYLCNFGDVSWHRSEDGDLVGEELDLDDIYVFNAEALPGPSGERLAFVTGSGMRDRGDGGVVAVVDEEGVPRWSAVGPKTSIELARLDRGDASSLFVLATKTGDLFVVDGAGTLLHHRTLPQVPDEEIGVAIYDLDVGPFGADHYGIAVTMLHRIAVYRMER